jgi:calcium/calmodulin-dependent protein kinase I
MGNETSSSPTATNPAAPGAPPKLLRQASMEQMGKSLLTRAYAKQASSCSRGSDVVHEERARRESKSWRSPRVDGDPNPNFCNFWTVQAPQGSAAPSVVLGGPPLSVDRSVSDRFRFGRLLGSGVYGQVFLGTPTRGPKTGGRRRRRSRQHRRSSFARRADVFATSASGHADLRTCSTSNSTQLERHASASPASALPRADVVAIKVIPRDTVAPVYEEQMRREAALLELLSDHRHIVAMHEFAEGERNFYMVMELVPSTVLETIVNCPYNKDTTFQISEATLGSVVHQLLGALAHCHAQGIAHLDVKPDNLLIGPDGQVRLCDFGLAARVPCRRSSHTLLFAPPEIFTEKMAYTGTDVWAAGVLLFVLLTGYFPFNTKVGVNDLRERICLGISPAHLAGAKELSPSSRDLISSLVCVPWQSRMSAKDAMAHRWFGELEQEPRGQQDAEVAAGGGPATQVDMAMEAMLAEAPSTTATRSGGGTPAAAISLAVVKNLRQISLVPVRASGSTRSSSSLHGNNTIAMEKPSLEMEAWMMSRAVHKEEEEEEEEEKRAMPAPPLLRGLSLEREIDDLVAW